jgi:hypothetical protein
MAEGRGWRMERVEKALARSEGGWLGFAPALG